MFLPIHEDAPEGDNMLPGDSDLDWSQETISMPYAVKIVGRSRFPDICRNRGIESQSKAKCGRLEQLVPFFNLRSFNEV
jgi:hypothetical protein